MVEAVYTNPLVYSPCPVHHNSLYLGYLHVSQQLNNSQLLVHFDFVSEWMDQRK